MTTVLRTVRWLALGAIVGLGAAWAMKVWVGDHASPQSIATAAIGGPFELVDQNGKTRTEKDLLGKYTIIYFGYTYCPDACPTALLAISQALDMLGAKADDFQPVFVTVDPERDTAKQMGEYVRTVDERFIGLTGSAEQVAKAAKAYRVFYRKVTPEGSSEYLMDHTSLIYLMGPDGKYLAHFSHETPVEKIAETLRRYAG
ncbi:MAG: redoxin domain-containing protein [Alphaproteobacteria bacterium]|nr:redoxin domain-containing protein [Alphaproteobacteria bacterium]